MLIRSAAMLLGIVTCVALVGCGDSGDSPTGPQTGSVLLRLTTTGKRPDPDGFLARVDGGVPQVVPVNGTVEFQALAGGAHILTLDGVAWNCTLSATTMNVQAVPGTQTSVSLTAHCPRILSNEVLFATEQYGFVEVAAMSPDGTVRDRITTDQLVNTSPSASPDGRSIAFSSMRDGTWSLYVMDAEGTNIREIGRSSFDGNAAWSPEGTRIAFRSELPGPFGAYGRIWIVNADGTGLRQLSPETADYKYDAQPSWSPDGTRVVFSRSGDLYAIKADGTGLVQILTCPLGCDDPAWSPNGQRIAYQMGTSDAHWDVFTMNAGGGDIRRITSDVAQEEEPTWSPDGTEIIYQRVVDGRFQLYRIAASGGASVRISPPQGSDSSPSWVRPQL